jgi:DNA-binding MarR family transcriptional regulator
MSTIFLVMDLSIINWLKDGIYRLKILNLLKDKNYLSSELADKLNINRASMSRILKKLKEKKLVETISSNSRTITYVISTKGKDILNKI